MLEQCENLNEVELFLETKTSDGKQHKDANYILAILDSRKKFVAHERFQYVLLKKFGETDQQVNMFFVHLLLLTQQKLYFETQMVKYLIYQNISGALNSI